MNTILSTSLNSYSRHTVILHTKSPEIRARYYTCFYLNRCATTKCKQHTKTGRPLALYASSQITPSVSFQNQNKFRPSFPTTNVRYLSESADHENGKITQKRKPANTSLEATAQYKKGQLDKITQKFQSIDDTEPLTIGSDEELQPMWKDMESRVLKRRLPPKISDANGVVSGRRNVRKTDEEAWLAAGLYDTDETKNDKN